MLESLEKLRGFIDDQFMENGKAWREGMAATYEVQDEIDSRYMELPLDADGVPIRVGDVVVDYKTPRTVVAITQDSIVMNGYPCTGEQGYRFGIARNHKHHKPRTVEDVLRGFWHDSMDADAFCTIKIDDVIAKYAAELRMRDGDDR